VPRANLAFRGVARALASPSGFASGTRPFNVVIIVHQNKMDGPPGSEMTNFLQVIRVCLIFVFAVGLAPACHRSAPPNSAQAPCPDRQAELKATRQFLAENREHYRAALARARQWVENLEVNPLKLREAGMKGKKKLTELLDTYRQLYLAVPAEEKPALMKRIQAVAEITYRPEYHDLLKVSDEQFKQDSTSYLRAAYLLDKLGLDTKLYRAEIRKIQSRLDSQMKERGSHQQMAFAWYYRYFGLAEPFPLAEGYKQGVIYSRRDPYQYSKAEIYQLTHEIFVPYEFGDKPDADFFNADDQAYLRRALDRHATFALMLHDPDMTGELVMGMNYLRFTDLPIYRDALNYLLQSQRPNGSWGNYEDLRAKYGDTIDQNLYLHTTMVTLEALSGAFSAAAR
jgi:hypothetical protein